MKEFILIACVTAIIGGTMLGLAASGLTTANKLSTTTKIECIQNYLFATNTQGGITQILYTSAEGKVLPMRCQDGYEQPIIEQKKGGKK